MRSLKTPAEVCEETVHLTGDIMMSLLTQTLKFLLWKF